MSTSDCIVIATCVALGVLVWVFPTKKTTNLIEKYVANPWRLHRLVKSAKKVNKRG